ncbi:MAG: FAD-dependent oxidoreductase [Acidothermaceae bacterium]
MRVLVVGGGVSGLAVARALITGGHEVCVFERAPSLRPTGGAVTLWSNGIAVLNALDVDYSGVGCEVETFDAWRSDGRPIWHVDVRAIRRRLGFGALTIPRSRLVERLAAGLPHDVVSFNCDVAAVETDAGAARVILNDGQTIEGDVVIGADGHRSIVRRQLVDPADAALTGWVTWQALAPLDHPLTRGRLGVNVIGAEGICGILPAGEGLLQWWFEIRRPSSGIANEEPVQMLRDRFGSWRGPAREILELISDAECFVHVRHRVPHVWGTARSTLVGDSAHVMPPALAQGANQSLEDAWVLAKRLHATDLAASLRAYENARRRRVAAVSRLAMLATTQQDGVMRRVARLPSAPTTFAYGVALKAASSLL